MNIIVNLINSLSKSIFMAADIMIKGATEEEVWRQLKVYFKENSDLLKHKILIEEPHHSIMLDIDIDLGGGFESGYSTTIFQSPVTSSPSFRFAIHEESFLNEIGKFFGMEDVVIGYEEFDDHFIIKTTDKKRVKHIFEEKRTRETLSTFKHLTMGIAIPDEDDTYYKGPYLEMLIEEGITDPVVLRRIYHAFHTILVKLEATENPV